MQRLYLIAMAAVVVLAIGFCTLIIVSLIPYFSVVGWMSLALVAIALLCGCALLLSFTWSLMGRMSNRRHLLIAGEIVAYLGRNNEITHLSAMHEAAKIPLPQTVIKEIAAPKEQAATVDDETVMELDNKGTTLRSIVEATGLSYYAVQKTTSAKRSD